jgi:N-acetylglutamate synthase-like GNAT family acetyltransferase
MKIVTPTTLQDFDNYYQLRWQILRKPWGQPKGSEVTSDEDACVHAMACDDAGEVIGVARLQFNSPTVAQVRCVAVDTKAQGRGVGTKLMLHLESIAREKGAAQLVLDARENAVQFYESLGYQIVEKSYLLFNEIQHYRMRKYL